MYTRSHPTLPRSTLWAENGMVASSHPSASLAALDILREGGTAMDAAIAAHLVLGVVEPMSTGIGGDAFCLYAPGGCCEPPVAYNGSGRAPAGLFAEFLLEQGIRELDTESAHSVTIPGSVDAFCRLHEDYGKLDLERVFAPAIQCAEEGYAVAPVIARYWARAEEKLRQGEESTRRFLPRGRPPRPGDLLRNPELAHSLRDIAQQGRRVFYEGWIAEDLVAALRAESGVHTVSDFAAHLGEYVAPISTAFEGNRVFECPPNGQGIIALLMLNTLSGLDLGSMDPLGAERLHLTLEAGRLAFRDRAAYLADPAMAKVPVESLLSADYADRQRTAIDPNAAMHPIPPTDIPMHRDTVYACAVDRDRNAASLISSLYDSFGSGVVGSRSGITTHCRGAGFVVSPGHPNCVAPGKRPMHTIIPGMLARKGRAVMPFGVMGKDYQPWGHVHVLQNLCLYGMEPQEALDLPRFTHDEGLAMMEKGVPAAVCQELVKRGHRVQTASEPLGGGQLIRIDWERGVLAGGSEPRKDGIALGY